MRVVFEYPNMHDTAIRKSVNSEEYTSVSTNLMTLVINHMFPTYNTIIREADADVEL